MPLLVVAVALWSSGGLIGWPAAARIALNLRRPAGRDAGGGNPTAWSVRDLVNHFVGGNLMFAGILRGGPPPA